ncbi:MAG: glycine cleavage T C-terminal barrel domain-containing protein, partial [Bacillota bacterium]
PSLEKNIGLAYIPAEYAVAGTEIDVVIRGKDCRAQVVKKPFYIRPK